MRKGIDGLSQKYFNCDTFNEMRPPTANGTYLAASSAAVVAGLRATLPEAVWVMQGWLFTEEQDASAAVRAPASPRDLFGVSSRTASSRTACQSRKTSRSAMSNCPVSQTVRC